MKWAIIRRYKTIREAARQRLDLDSRMSALAVGEVLSTGSLTDLRPSAPGLAQPLFIKRSKTCTGRWVNEYYTRLVKATQRV